MLLSTVFICLSEFTHGGLLNMNLSELYCTRVYLDTDTARQILALFEGTDLHDLEYGIQKACSLAISETTRHAGC